ncbi:MAG TPA: redoxin domain-containing protein, partial [Candidatus Binatus sp.]|uniref:peroxiredoxin family protein n=1 Tax=Candidatus Binatus sp. TaxID=2811406 RepID=UPI002F3E9EE1
FGSKRDGATFLNFSALADQMGKPWAGDSKHRVWYFGAEAAERGNALRSLGAPDFELPDLDGKLHRLSDYRGSKVFLLAWASW